MDDTIADIIAQLITAGILIAGIFIFAIIWPGGGEMK
jgi:hypothetical protein